MVKVKEKIKIKLHQNKCRLLKKVLLIIVLKKLV